MTDLPGKPAPAMTALWATLSDEERQALLPHLLGGTSAERIARELSNAGHRIGVTSIKVYRRSLRQEGL